MTRGVVSAITAAAFAVATPVAADTLQSGLLLRTTDDAGRLLWNTGMEWTGGGLFPDLP